MAVEKVNVTLPTGTMEKLRRLVPAGERSHVIAEATAQGLRKVAESIQDPGGYEAVQLRVAEQYITKFGELAKSSNTLVLPASVSDVGSMIALAMNVINRRPQTSPPPQ